MEIADGREHLAQNIGYTFATIMPIWERPAAVRLAHCASGSQDGFLMAMGGSRYLRSVTRIPGIVYWLALLLAND